MTSADTRILITGGSGFIGTNLVDYYISKGLTVLSFDSKTPKKSEHLPLWKKVDILDKDLLTKEVIGFNPTHVYHLAARTDLDEKKELAGYAANTEGVSNMIAALSGCTALKRVAFTSSMYVCTPGHDPAHYEDYSPHTVYGRSKVESERIVRQAMSGKYDWFILRPTSIWGPWFGHPYNEFFHHVRRRTYFDIKGKTATKTYGFIFNSITQMDKLMFTDANKINGKTFYIGDHPGLNINRWALEIAHQLGLRLIPMPLFIIKAGSWFGDVINVFGFNFPLQSFRMKNMTTDNTISLLSDTRALAPEQPYSLEEGVAITLQWLKEHDEAFRSNAR